MGALKDGGNGLPLLKVDRIREGFEVVDQLLGAGVSYLIAHHAVLPRRGAGRNTRKRTGRCRGEAGKSLLAESSHLGREKTGVARMVFQLPASEAINHHHRDFAGGRLVGLVTQKNRDQFIPSIGQAPRRPGARR